MLSIIAFAAIIVFTVYSFKTARDYGRNPFLWAVITFGIGFGLQFVLPIVIGIILAIIWLISGNTQAQMQAKIEGPAFFIGIITIVLSFIGMGLVLKFISRVPEGVELPPSRDKSSLGLDI